MNRRIRIAFITLAILCAAVAIYAVLDNEKALLTHPKGIMATEQIRLLKLNLLLMLVIVAPTIFLILLVAWQFRAHNAKAPFEPEKKWHKFTQPLLWVIPSIIVAALAVITWERTHTLDPYKPLEGEAKPLTIQVVALDWKWLFIYPDQGIATLNLVQFPARTPINFLLTSDKSPMNSFWIPQLSGQIYAMSGMVTPLHMMADGVGEYTGRAAEINGEGLAGMTFVVRSTTQADFEKWVAEVRKSSLKLDQTTYETIAQRFENREIVYYSNVERGLFHRIVMKYMSPSL